MGGAVEGQGREGEQADVGDTIVLRCGDGQPIHHSLIVKVRGREEGEEEGEGKTGEEGGRAG